MTLAPPPTQARALLALLAPWIERVEAGPAPGDVDLTHARRRLAVSVRRVRAVAGGRVPTGLPDASVPTRRERQCAAVEGLVRRARALGAPGISDEELRKKVEEIAEGERAAHRDFIVAMWSMSEGCDLRFADVEIERPRNDRMPPPPSPREVRIGAWEASATKALDEGAALHEAW